MKPGETLARALLVTFGIGVLLGMGTGCDWRGERVHVADYRRAVDMLSSCVESHRKTNIEFQACLDSLRTCVHGADGGTVSR